ncbi:TetR family transcriptional regulator [Bradyrhizobium sp. 2TAF24]|uniref:TetR family transcriptional regulator n=1 Tax=Bradyrhizobium sp. 2TAF24 TaxID=3233011 RepID=UPI003F8DE249
MAPRTKPRISPRKAPQQARSAQLVADVLEAATHVLTRDGAPRFTTARVAERAGVSVGSVYQYFPNKEAILFRLQVDEWTRTSALLHDILADRTCPPQQRLRTLLDTFLRTEREEAALRTALDDAAPLYRDAPEARQMEARGQRLFTTFLGELMPKAAPRERAVMADIVTTIMGAVGDTVTSDHSDADVARKAAILGDMLCGYFAGRAAAPGARSARTRSRF